MRTLFWVVLVIFSIVTTKIIHYSSLCWFPITYFAGYHTYLIHTNRGQNHWSQKVTLFITALGLLTVMLLLPLVFGRTELPHWATPHLDAYTKGLFDGQEPWSFTALIPAMLMILLVFPWLIKNFLHNKWHPGKLFIGVSAVALSSYFFLLPPVGRLLQ